MTDTTSPKPAAKKPCKVTACKVTTLARGFCSKHYSQWRAGMLTATGAPTMTRRKPPTIKRRKTQALPSTKKNGVSNGSKGFTVTVKPTARVSEALLTALMSGRTMEKILDEALTTWARA